MNIRSGKPRVIELPDHYKSNTSDVLYCIVGTEYGFLHNSMGNIRTWKTRGGANKHIKNHLQHYFKEG